MQVLNAIWSKVTHRFHVHTIFRKARYDAKVFCIGYNKTGTTSLGQALRLLGYRHSSFNKRVWRDFYDNGKTEKIIRYTAKFDSLDDLPWLLEDMIPVMDSTFPNSKFIYLERDEESWRNSFKNWREKRFDTVPDLDEATAKFRRHRDFVMNYFKDRSSEHFIVLNIKDENGFKKLADFLGKQTDQSSFPHRNKTSQLKPRTRGRQ